MNRAQEIAWAAALFEGEGCACTRRLKNRRSTHSVALQLGMVDREPVEKFARIVGAGTLRRYHPPSHQSRKPTWMWRTSAKAEVIRIGELLLPYLFPRRRAQMLAVLEVARG